MVLPFLPNQKQFEASIAAGAQDIIRTANPKISEGTIALSGIVPQGIKTVTILPKNQRQSLRSEVFADSMNAVLLNNIEYTKQGHCLRHEAYKDNHILWYNNDLDDFRKKHGRPATAEESQHILQAVVTLNFVTTTFNGKYPTNTGRNQILEETAKRYIPDYKTRPRDSTPTICESSDPAIFTNTGQGDIQPTEDSHDLTTQQLQALQLLNFNLGR